MKKIVNYFKKNFNYYDFKNDSADDDLLKNDLVSEKNCKDLIKENQKLKVDFKLNVLDKFKSRRSIRKFSDQEVEWESIYKIIEAGLNGPVAGGIQNYKIIVVSDLKERQELGKLAFQQYWLADAPYILVIIRDDYRLQQLYPSEGEIYAIQNSAAMIENILMMAHFLDLGSCWVEAYDNNVLKEYLKVPMELKIDAIIPIGYSLENPKVVKDPVDSHVFYNKYNNLNRK